MEQPDCSAGYVMQRNVGYWPRRASRRRAPMAAAIERVVAQVEPAIVTQQKLMSSSGVKQDGDEVVFSCKFDSGSCMLLSAGEFNNWSPMSTPMQHNGRLGDAWITVYVLPRGRYRYRLIVDGKWMTDLEPTLTSRRTSIGN